MMSRRLAAVLLLGVLATGCGTTVPLAQQHQAALGQGASVALGGAPLQTTGDAASADAAANGVSGDTGQSAPVATTGTAVASGGSPVAASTVTGTISVAPGSKVATVAPRAATSSPVKGAHKGAVASAKPQASTSAAAGATATGAAPVKVGLLYLSGASTEAAALGVNGLDTGDTVAQANAIVSNINSHGGINGAPITLVPYAIPAADSANNETAAQQAGCVALTQDDKVAVVISYLQLLASSIDCFAQAATPLIDDASSATDATTARDPGVLSAPGDFFPGRLYTDEVDSLFASGWLTKSSKVGIYSYSGADEAGTVNGYIKPALQKLGITNITIESVDNSGAGAAQNSSVSLAFATAGVDRIIPAFANPLFLMLDASSQGYKPEYALNSDFGAGALLETAAPKDQLAGSAGFGWQPWSDIGAGDRGPGYNADETLCQTLMNAAGQGSTTGTTVLLELQLCDSFFFLRDAAAKAGGTTGKAIVTGAAALSNYPSAATFASAFPGGRLDGASAYRLFTYESSCSCFQYTTPVTATS